MSASTINSAVSTLRVLFTVTLGRRDLSRALVITRNPRKLPEVLSVEEVARLLASAPGLKYKSALGVAYGAGLRVSEVAHLKIDDIDSTRMLLRVERGKGGRYRNAMLSPDLLALEQARYSAAHARRQFDAVDPDNRLVAGELERRWNDASQAIGRLEGELAAIEASKPAPLGEMERQQLRELGADLELAWAHPAATAATRKRILRAALREIIVCLEADVIEMVLHWQGGDHTTLKLKVNTAGEHRWTIPKDTLTLVRELARQIPTARLPGCSNVRASQQGEASA